MSMFLNFIRWQCLNKEDWNDGDIPLGTVIDDDQFIMEYMKLLGLPQRKRRV